MSYKQGFAWWSFTHERARGPELLEAAAELGYQGVDFLPPELWPEARALGLELVVADGHMPLEVGFCDRGQHRQLRDQVRRALEGAVAEGVLHLAVAAGDTTAPGERDALAACAEGLAPLAAEAASAGVPLVIEPLNSKVDHPGHLCDRTDWGAALVDAVDSPGLRLLYDVYHAQVMEGDLIRTLQANLTRIAHVHTAGVPGRRDLDGAQEVNWPAIASWLDEAGYDGYVTHELIPRGDAVASLRAAYAAFDRGGVLERA